MYPLTHAWFTRRVWGEPTETTILGTMLPDTIIVSGLDWSLTHEPGLELLAELASAGPSERDFARGWLSHAVDPHGLDYFGDHDYPGTRRGYCFELALPYADRAAEICGLSRDLGWWKAHNFVEMGIELLAAREWPDAARVCETALATVGRHEALIGRVSSLLAVDPESIRRGYEGFACFLQFDDISPQGLARAYERQVRAKHGVDGIDRQGAAALIEECAELARSTLEEFTLFATRNVLEIAAKL
jgi:hypothetical protein